MQYTLRDIPHSVDKALRARARVEGKSLNQVAVEALQQATGTGPQPPVHVDLDWMIGTWVEDPAFDQAIRDQDRVDAEDWR